MRKLLSATLFMAAVITLPACRTAPIYNVADTPVIATVAKPLTANQVQQAIVRAGGGLGWVMRAEKPGLIVGTLNIRSHQAVVEVPYTNTSYSIKYKSSQNLNQEGDQIHRNYNGWVMNLDRAIQAQLSSL